MLSVGQNTMSFLTVGVPTELKIGLTQEAGSGLCQNLIAGIWIGSIP